MNSILIIAHAPLASALRSAALHVFPDAAARVIALDVFVSQSPEQTLDVAHELLTKIALDSEVTGTLVLSDVLGATPCNVAQKLVNNHIKCVAGASLPMLLRAITYWHEPLMTMAEKAVAGGAAGAIAVA